MATKKKQMPARKDTGAMRESIGTKVDTTLVPYEFICAAAVGLNYGEKKYDARNFEKGLSERDLLMSIERHTRALMGGEYIDEDSGLPHSFLLSSSVAMFVACEARHTIVRDLPPPSIYGDVKECRIQNIASAAQVFQSAQNAMKDPSK